MGFLALAAPLLMGTATAGAGAAAAGGLTAASAGLAAGGALLSGVSAMAAGNYQAKVAKNNAAMLTQEHDTDLQAGQRAESEQRGKTTDLIASQMAAQGANGVDVNVGSAREVRDADQARGDFDALAVRYNAARAAWGNSVEASNQRAQGAMAKASGRMALASSFIGAASSLAGGAGKIAGMNASNKMVGVGAP